MIRIAEPNIGEAERAAVMKVLSSGRLANGEFSKHLEDAFARQVSRTHEAVAVSSGTAALHLALLAHGIGAGDEVITPAFSFQATANMILATGARPVFVDVSDDGNIDASRVEAAITTRTKALLPVHLYGRLCDMAALCDIAQRHGLVLIEDAAQAHAAELGGSRAGSFGTGCFSLYATKNLAAGEGGVVTTDNPEVAQRVRRLRSHGEDERYESVEAGYNYRITEMGAALAWAQIATLEERNDLRRANATYLSRELGNVLVPPAPTEPGANVWHQYTIRVPQGRDGLQQHLRERGVESIVYYPKALPAQSLYRELGYDASAFPTARRLAGEVLSLPVHPDLGQHDLDHIVAAVNEWTAKHMTRSPERR